MRVQRAPPHLVFSVEGCLDSPVVTSGWSERVAGAWKGAHLGCRICVSARDPEGVQPGPPSVCCLPLRQWPGRVPGTGQEGARGPVHGPPCFLPTTAEEEHRQVAAVGGAPVPVRGSLWPPF